MRITACDARRDFPGMSATLGRSIRGVSCTVQSSQRFLAILPDIPINGDQKYDWRQRMCVFLATSLIATAVSPSLAQAVADQAGTSQVFENSCAGCHANGGNIVKRDATLYKSDLQKYGLEDPGQLYSIIYAGIGSMPGFGEECEPKGKCTFGKRLTDLEIQDLALYILQQADSGWPSSTR